jgi:hypothetical protein
MLEILPESGGKIIWVRASGMLTDQDYREVFIPRLESVLKEHGKARLLFHADYDFAGWSIMGLWEDLKVDWRHKDDLEKMAVVAAPRWVDAATKIIARFMQGEVRFFLREQLAEAWEWIQEEEDLTPPGFSEPKT